MSVLYCHQLDGPHKRVMLLPKGWTFPKGIHSLTWTAVMSVVTDIFNRKVVDLPVRTRADEVLIKSFSN